MVIDCLKWYQNDRTLFKIIVDDIWWSKRIFKTIDLNGPLIYEDDWYTWNHLSKTVLICHSYLAKFLQFLNWVGLGPSDLWICLFSLFYVFSLSLMVVGEEINSIHLPFSHLLVLHRLQNVYSLSCAWFSFCFLFQDYLFISVQEVCNECFVCTGQPTTDHDPATDHDTGWENENNEDN